MSAKVTEIKMADPKSPPDLDRWAKKLADYAMPRALKKGFTVGQVASAFMNLAAEMAIMCRADEALFIETCFKAFRAAAARSVGNRDKTRKIIVEMVPPEEPKEETRKDTLQ